MNNLFSRYSDFNSLDFKGSEFIAFRVKSIKRNLKRGLKQ